MDHAIAVGATPLFLASQNGHLEVVLMLLFAGASVDHVFVNLGATALIAAANSGHARVVRALLDHGCDATLQHSSTKGTALHFAAMNGHRKCVILLAPLSSKKELEDLTSLVPLQVPAFARTPHTHPRTHESSFLVKRGI